MGNILKAIFISGILIAIGVHVNTGYEAALASLNKLTNSTYSPNNFSGDDEFSQSMRDTLGSIETNKLTTR